MFIAICVSIKAKSNKQKITYKFTNSIWYYIFVRIFIFGEKKIQSTLHIYISMDSTKDWKIFEKKFHEIPKIKKGNGMNIL